MRTMEEFDAMTDEAFVDFVYVGARPVFAVPADQRSAMEEAHKSWVSQMDNEEREMADWDTRTHSDWDLYAELRINGVDFDRLPEPVLQR